MALTPIPEDSAWYEGGVSNKTYPQPGQPWTASDIQSVINKMQAIYERLLVPGSGEKFWDGYDTLTQRLNDLSEGIKFRVDADDNNSDFFLNKILPGQGVQFISQNLPGNKSVTIGSQNKVALYPLDFATNTANYMRSRRITSGGIFSTTMQIPYDYKEFVSLKLYSRPNGNSGPMFIVFNIDVAAAGEDPLSNGRGGAGSTEVEYFIGLMAEILVGAIPLGNLQPHDTVGIQIDQNPARGHTVDYFYWELVYRPLDGATILI